jgi:hypothetical protein
MKNRGPSAAHREGSSDRPAHSIRSRSSKSRSTFSGMCPSGDVTRSEPSTTPTCEPTALASASSVEKSQDERRRNRDSVSFRKPARPAHSLSFSPCSRAAWVSVANTGASLPVDVSINESSHLLRDKSISALIPGRLSRRACRIRGAYRKSDPEPRWQGILVRRRDTFWCRLSGRAMVTPITAIESGDFPNPAIYFRLRFRKCNLTLHVETGDDFAP